MSGVAPATKTPSAYELEAYKQAHEIRRKWEGYIWQYGVLTLALIGFLAGRLSTGSDSGHPVEMGLVERSVLALLTLFLGSTFLNVYRARVLMKQLEGSIVQMHKEWGLRVPIVPSELDGCLPKRRHKYSSTRVAVLAHFLLFVVALALTVFSWTLLPPAQ